MNTRWVFASLIVLGIAIAIRFAESPTPASDGSSEPRASGAESIAAKNTPLSVESALVRSEVAPTDGGSETEVDLRIRVLDEVGTPVGDARVVVLDATHVRGSDRTDASGLVSIVVPREPENLTAYVSAIGFMDRYVSVRATRSVTNGPTDVSLSRLQLSRVIGVVVDEEERPVADAPVRAGAIAMTRARFDAYQRQAGVAETRTNTAGHFAIENVPAGQPTWVSAGFGAQIEPTPVRALEPGETAEVRIRLFSTIAIEIEVVDARSGAPIPRAALQAPDGRGPSYSWATPSEAIPGLIDQGLLSEPFMTCDEMGIVRTRVRARRRCVLNVRAPEHRTQRYVLDSSIARHVIRLEPKSYIRVELVLDDGNPLSFIEDVPTMKRGTIPSAGPIVGHLARGMSLQWNGADGVRDDLDVDWASFPSSIDVDLGSHSGQAGELIASIFGSEVARCSVALHSTDLRLILPAASVERPTGALTLVVLDANGNPPTNALNLMLRGQPDMEAGTGVEVGPIGLFTASDGVLTADRVVPGAYDLMLQDAVTGDSVHVGHARVEPNSRADLGTVRLAMSGSVVVEVGTPTGSAAASRVRLWSYGMGMYLPSPAYLPTDRDMIGLVGSPIEWPQVPSGAYRVEARSAGLVPASAEVFVDSGQPVVVPLALNSGYQVDVHQVAQVDPVDRPTIEFWSTDERFIERCEMGYDAANRRLLARFFLGEGDYEVRRRDGNRVSRVERVTVDSNRVVNLR